jgi:hypothetical protein
MKIFLRTAAGILPPQARIYLQLKPTPVRILCLLMLALTPCFAQSSGELTVTETSSVILTHVLTAAGPIPTALDPNGVYPYVSYAETSNRPVPAKYRLVTIENKHVRVNICPDLGGKVTSMIVKPAGKEVLYVPEVIRPVRILPRFYFVAGGIEVSFPISHSPSQNEQVLYKVDRTPDRVYVSCGERELRFGMQWTVEYSLGQEDNFLTERVLMHNPGTKPYPWMSWSNAAVPTDGDTQYHFPAGEVLRHASAVDTIHWKTHGPKTESDIKEMTGYFWRTRDVNNFGVYTASTGTGLYHSGDQRIAPGMKLWSYGVGPDREWSMLSTGSRKPYAEIQGGPIADQSIKLELKPNETRSHVEYWIPTDKPLNIYKIKTPNPVLRKATEIPIFGWARKQAVEVWEQLSIASANNTTPPTPPGVEEMLWPPSGMEKLSAALEWVIGKTDGKTRELWRFYFGTWLAGTGQTDRAVAVLAECKSGISKALLSRIYKTQGQNREALELLLQINEPWLQLHPQVFVERDKLLRAAGPEKIAAREQWFSRVDALQDEWVLERKVQLLIDKGDAAAAENLLLSIPFQKVHQTYTRTNLWRQITEKLNKPFLPIPASLGEDQLATFGAYREFE